MLYGFIEILSGGKAGIVWGNRPYQAGQGRFFSRLRLLDPVHQHFCFFGRLLVLRRRIANHQHIRLKLLTVMLEQPLGLRLA